MLKLFIEWFAPAAGAVILGMLPNLIRQASSWAKAKAAGNKIEFAINKSVHLIEVIVSDVVVNVDPVVRKSLADGNIDKAELDEISAVVLKTLKKWLTADGISDLAKTLGITPDSVREYLMSIISAKLRASGVTLPLSSPAA